MNQPVKPAPTEETMLVTLKSDRMREEIGAQLPPGSDVDVDKFTATVMAAIRHDPKILEATRSSVYNAILEAASDGLLPDGEDGVINTYNTKVSRNPDRWEKVAQWQRMVGGIIKLFAKANIDAYAVSVYANDKIEAWHDGNGQHIRIDPVLFGDRGERIGSIAIARMGNGTTRFEAMNLEDLKKVRAASKSPDSGPWEAWPDRMEQKSALHRLAKRVAFIDPVAAAQLRKLNDEFGDPKAPVEAAPDISVGTGRPAALQAALAAPQQAGVELPAARVEREPAQVPAASGEQGTDGPREGDII